MTPRRDYLPALDGIEAALEASCGALITLESLGRGATRPAGKADGMQEPIAQAMRSLKQAIESLRAARTDGTGALALGFVLKRDGSAAWGEAHQSKPRRTA